MLIKKSNQWSVWEIFITLTSGASLYMVPDEMLLDSEHYIDFINRNIFSIDDGSGVVTRNP